jgi:hypothetical protein
MPEQRRNFRPIPGFPGGQYFDVVCGYCLGEARNWWNCPGRHNHQATRRHQLLPPIGEVVPVPFDGDWDALAPRSEPPDGQPSHCGVPAMLMADSRPWWSVNNGPCWYCPECEQASLLRPRIRYDGVILRSWCSYPLKDENRNPISFKVTP